MLNKKKILLKIKNIVKSEEPNASIILYGSHARGDFHKESDIDLLILIDKTKITSEDERKIKYPLYDLEFDTGQIISPVIYSKKDWESRHRITPLYENIKKEGQLL